MRGVLLGILLLGLWSAVVWGMGPVEVVATSAVLADLVQQVGGDAVQVVTIIPPGFCPAHYDLKPSDLLAVSRAELVLYHGFEPWLEKFLAHANPSATVVPLKGPWNTPEALEGKAQEIGSILGKLRPQLAERFASSASSYVAKVRELAEELSARAQALSLGEVPAIVMQWQADFVRWLGLKIVATYPPEERLSLRDLSRLFAQGKEAGVLLVIDNLQSGVSFGAKLAHALGAMHVVLTNFPGAIPGTVDLLSMLRVNAEAVFSAVEALRSGP